MCQRIGWFPTGTIGLGRSSVSSRRRVPNPPHNTKTGTFDTSRVNACTSQIIKLRLRDAGRPNARRALDCRSVFAPGKISVLQLICKMPPNPALRWIPAFWRRCAS